MSLGTASALSFTEVELLIGCGGFIACQILPNSECAQGSIPGVSRRVLISVGERVRAQTNSQGPKEQSKLRRNEVTSQ